MLRTRLVAALLPAVLAGLVGCPGFGEQDATTGALEPPTYLESVGPLLQERCVSCHGGDDRDRVRAEFRLDRCADGADGVLGARAMRERIVAQVSTDAMPRDQDPLSSAEKALLASWAESGGACEPVFSSHVRPLFATYCVACHGLGEPKDPTTPDTLRLDRCTTPETGDAVGAQEAAELIRIWLTDPLDPMPPIGEVPRPSEAEVNRMLLWIDRGAPCGDDPGGQPQDADGSTLDGGAEGL